MGPMTVAQDLQRTFFLVEQSPANQSFFATLFVQSIYEFFIYLYIGCYQAYFADTLTDSNWFMSSTYLSV